MDVILTEDERYLAAKLSDAGPTLGEAEAWLAEVITIRNTRALALADKWEEDARKACFPPHDGCPDCIGREYAAELREVLK